MIFSVELSDSKFVKCIYLVSKFESKHSNFCVIVALHFVRLLIQLKPNDEI